MRAASIKAYQEEAPKLNRREHDIYQFMAGRSPMTDREIMQRMGFTEPNAVRPRITGLIDKGLLQECGAVKCNVTGKTVRQVRVMPKRIDGNQFLMGF